MNPFISFDVKGLNGISISDDIHKFETTDKGPIEAVEFILENRDIAGIKVYFSSETVIDSELINSTFQMVELYLANIVGELDVIINGFSLKTGQVYNPNLPPKDGPIFINDMIMMCDELSTTCCYTISRYEELFSALPTDAYVKDKMLLFSNIMKIDNLAVRYLMQYELLLGIVPQNDKNRRGQKDVTDFIQNTYNPTTTNDPIGFHPTRRSGQCFDEDDITYYRNILAHDDSSAIPDNFKNILSSSSKAITKVIFFALKQLT